MAGCRDAVRDLKDLLGRANGCGKGWHNASVPGNCLWGRARLGPKHRASACSLELRRRVRSSCGTRAVSGLQSGWLLKWRLQSGRWWPKKSRVLVGKPFLYKDGAAGVRPSHQRRLDLSWARTAKHCHRPRQADLGQPWH